MKKVTGIGGIFFKSSAPKELLAWYREHLGIESEDWGGWVFQWREKDNPEQIGQTVFTPFKQDTKKMVPSTEPYMFNFRVADLSVLIAQLQSEGVQLVGEMQDTEYGKFAWIMDPDGRKIELWQPPDVDASSAANEDVTKP
jgi:predicted enzyme related to lactoylglutathione lyase